MLEETEGRIVAAGAGSADQPPPDVRRLAEVGPVLAPDREVLESARFRLAPLPSAAPGPQDRRCLADIQAIDAVLRGTRPGALAVPGPLDAGAALALLTNVRRQLDRLEADMLGAARQVGLSWDLIGAIMGVPAAAAEERVRVLRVRPDPR
jgi:hypothetical protein